MRVKSNNVSQKIVFRFLTKHRIKEIKLNYLITRKNVAINKYVKDEITDVIICFKLMLLCYVPVEIYRTTCRWKLLGD